MFITYEIFLTQLDQKVCSICRPFHGQIFKKGEGPIPRISTHPTCRCRRQHHSTVFVPVVIPVDEEPDEEKYKDNE